MMLINGFASICYVCWLFSIRTVKADLPIHALSSDALGLWRILETETLHEMPQLCGSTLPNTNAGNLKLGDYRKYLERTYGGLTENVLELVDERYPRRGEIPPRNHWRYLKVKSPASGQEFIGTWTMVYDEGLSIEVAQKRYFGYFKYSKVKSRNCPMVMEGSQTDSHGNVACYKTNPSEIRLGWMTKKVFKNGKPANMYGCFYAEKLKKEEKRSYVLDESDAFPGTSKPCASSGLWEKKNYTQFTDLSPFKFLQLHKGVSFRSLHHSRSSSEKKLPQAMTTRFMQAAERSHYACKAGTSARNDYKDLELPRYWSWGDGFNGTGDNIQPFSQGQCGSCYAMASIYVFTKRFEILLQKLYPQNKLESLPRPSVQHIVDCSPFGQGCFGGFPFLVGKHLSEIGVLSESEVPYKLYLEASEPSCSLETGTSDNRWFASAYGYIGGCYECSNEFEIMKEIYHHGPVVVAVDAPQSLFTYNNGIYDGEPNDHGSTCDLPLSGLNGWEYTNHAIAIVGWGEEQLSGEEPTKYWICRNTWGDSWGVGGFFKVKRGVNNCGIESQAVYIDPDLGRGMAAKLVKSLKG